MSEPLRIVVVSSELAVADPGDEYAVTQAERSRSLRIGLLENGFNLVSTLPADVFLAERLTQLAPDMIIVDAESEARDALEHVVVATRDARRPIVMFTNDGDRRAVNAAMDAGVTAYVVAGLSSERIRPILEVALARFQHEERLRQELAATRSELQEQSAELRELTATLNDRKLIERAKGVLMHSQSLSEQQAHDKLRKTAMNKNLRLVDVAQRVLDLSDLWG